MRNVNWQLFVPEKTISKTSRHFVIQYSNTIFILPLFKIFSSLRLLISTLYNFRGNMIARWALDIIFDNVQYFVYTNPTHLFLWSSEYHRLKRLSITRMPYKKTVEN